MRPAVPRFHLISDRTLLPLETLVELMPALLGAGIDAVHLREKDLTAGQLAAAASALRDSITAGVTFLINDRVDVALLSGADGVQLGETSLTPEDARRIVAPGMLIGRSVHDVEGARRAEAGGADFLLAGNIFPSRSKPGLAGRGLAFIADLSSAVTVPVIAVGGIRPEHVVEILHAGAYGVAVISGVLAADDPIKAARDYRNEIRRSMLIND